MKEDNALKQALQNRKTPLPPPGLNRMILQRVAAEKQRMTARKERLSYLWAIVGSVIIITITGVTLEYLFDISVLEIGKNNWQRLTTHLKGFEISLSARISLFIASATLLLLIFDHEIRQQYAKRRNNRRT